MLATSGLLYIKIYMSVQAGKLVLANASENLAGKTWPGEWNFV